MTSIGISERHSKWCSVQKYATVRKYVYYTNDTESKLYKYKSTMLHQNHV